MVAIIRRHNALNGLIFSLLEFGLIALLVGAFAIYYLIHRDIALAFITVGITLNCLPVVVLACQTLLNDQASGWFLVIANPSEAEGCTVLRVAVFLRRSV